MNGSKGVLTSLGCTGSLVAFFTSAATAMEHFGVLPLGSTPAIVGIVCPVVGSFMGFWGRLRAKKTIKGIV